MYSQNIHSSHDSQYRSFYSRWSNCCRCDLGSIAKQRVFFRGHVPCQFVFVGEAPGATEDVLGLPFVGPAGKMLDRIIRYVSEEVQFTYAITNLICCRPPDNQEPTAEWIQSCAPRLTEFLAICNPWGVISLGRKASELSPSIAVLSVPHPAYLLRLSASRQLETLNFIVNSITLFALELIDAHAKVPRQPGEPHP